MIYEFLNRILVFGLPGSGKTTFAKRLWQSLKDENINYAYFNNNEIRNMFQDYDFSFNGRMRQSDRMFKLCEMAREPGAIADFVCPYEPLRARFNYFIWMNTIKESQYEDTNKAFQTPQKIKPDFEIINFEYNYVIKEIVKKIKKGHVREIDTTLR